MLFTQILVNPLSVFCTKTLFCRIESDIFWGCHKLRKVNIPEAVKQIRPNTFRHCKSLKSITIPKTVEEIWWYAFGYFYDYEKEVNIKIEDFTIYGYVGSEAEIYAKENNFNFISLD